MGWLIATAILMTFLASLCVTGEVALTRAARIGAQELTGNGRKQPAEIEQMLAEGPRYLNTLLLLRVTAETAATVLLTVALVHWLGSGWRAFLIAAAIMIVAGYVLIGVIGRALGRRYTAGAALAAAAFLRPVTRVLGPLAWLATVVSNVITPGGRARDGQLGSEAELRGLVDLLEQRRVIQPGERKMIHSVFELGDTLVREVMVPRTDMVFIERGKTLSQALSLALRSGFSRVPVIGENEDDVVGVAYLKDIVARSHEHPDCEQSEKVESIMRPATYVPDSKLIDVLLREMQARQSHVAIVIDEYGGTAGLVTIEDILEEIVGEIADEYDQEQPMVEWLTRGSTARVTSRLPVDELAALFDVSIEAEDVETVAGLLAQAIGRVPIAGSVGTVAGLRLTAENLAGRRNRIGTVLVERLEPGPGEPHAAAEQAPGHADDDERLRNGEPASPANGSPASGGTASGGTASGGAGNGSPANGAPGASRPAEPDEEPTGHGLDSLP
ncbi:MAG TPA: hemolysin family protein [Streptosporangiaceae bacterium]|jgi:CBS domain containing-hemolysin-like protein